jgi:hypothetical protein
LHGAATLAAAGFDDIEPIEIALARFHDHAGDEAAGLGGSERLDATPAGLGDGRAGEEAEPALEVAVLAPRGFPGAQGFSWNTPT